MQAEALTCDLLLLNQRAELLAVELLVQLRSSLIIKVEAVAQLPQHLCLGWCGIQPPTRELLPQQPPAMLQ